jgi:hypothetical protein
MTKEVKAKNVKAKPMSAFDEIKTALLEAVAIAKGEAEPARTYVPARRKT